MSDLLLFEPVMNLYTAVQKSTGLREPRNIYVRLWNTETHNVIEANIASAVIIDEITFADDAYVQIFRVKFETATYVISTVITFGLQGSMPMTHHINDEDYPNVSYIAFI